MNIKALFAIVSLSWRMQGLLVLLFCALTFVTIVHGKFFEEIS